MKPVGIIKKAFFFKGFNELRFLAAAGVLVHHLELYKHRNGQFSLFATFLKPFIRSLGENMVYLFFVLSGFLITYLLIIEIQNTSKINIKKFYYRRVLRIWPLYFLIIGVSYLMIPSMIRNNDFFIGEKYYYEALMNTDYIISLPFFLFFCSNVALSYGHRLVGASHSWSVSVEEQFYVIWPFVIKRFYKRLPLFLSVFICVKLIYNEYLYNYIPSNLGFINKFLSKFPVEYMALGAISAYFYVFKKVKIQTIFSKKINIFLTVIAIISLVLHGEYKFLLGALFSLLLLLISVNQSFFKKESIIGKLGVYSYGIYMYHPIIMFLVFTILNKSSLAESFLVYNLLLYSITFIITIYLSKYSYQYFEMFFLKLKNKKTNPLLTKRDGK